MRILQVAKPVTLGGVVWTVTTKGSEKYPHWCTVWRRWDESNGDRHWSEDVSEGGYLDVRYLHPRLRAAMGHALPLIPRSRSSRAAHFGREHE